MSSLQNIIFLCITFLLIGTLIFIGSYLQNTLVFSDYEDRFSPHGLIIKAVSIFIVVFLTAQAGIIYFKILYLLESSSKILTSWQTFHILDSVNSVQTILHVITVSLICIWIILVMVFSKFENWAKMFESWFRKD